MTGETQLIITDHAYDRMRERLGWNKKAGTRMAQKAYTDGLTHGETRGSLHRYLEKVYWSYCNANTMRIYAEALFIFNGTKLITVYALPTKYRKLMQQKERRET